MWVPVKAESVHVRFASVKESNMVMRCFSCHLYFERKAFFVPDDVAGERAPKLALGFRMSRHSGRAISPWAVNSDGGLLLRFALVVPTASDQATQGGESHLTVTMT